MIIREEYPKIFDALAMICEQGTDRAKQVPILFENSDFFFENADDTVDGYMVAVFLPGDRYAVR